MRALIALFAFGACGGHDDEVRLEQYREVPAPLVGGGVKLYLGDVELGRHAPVRVLGPDGGVLAQGDLRVGDELPFEVDGAAYAVIAVRYIDHLVGDEAVLRVQRR